MQRLLHKPPGQHVMVPEPAADLARVREAGGWIWLDLPAPDDAETEAIGRLFGFDRVALEHVLADDEFPKLDDYGEYLFVVTHSVTSADDRIGTHEVDVFLSSHYLVTFHAGPIPSLDWLWEEAQQTPGMAVGGPDRMLARIAEQAARRYLPLVDALDDRIDELEDAAIAGDPAVLHEVQALRRDSIRLRRTIAPQRDVYRELAGEGLAPVDDRARRRFDSVYDHHYRIVESLDAARSLLGSVLDTYRSSVAERMNEVMKVLTVFAAILLPLSLLAGIYGMNFANIPELEWRWAYFALLGIMATTAVGLWIYFARRGFIGGPRLDKIPRVVGRGLGGLVHVTTAPLRLAGSLLLSGVDDAIDHDGRYDEPPPARRPPPQREPEADPDE